MKITHSKLGEMKVEYKNGLTIDGMAGYIKYLPQGSVFMFDKVQTLQGQKAPGMKITREQSKELKAFEEASKKEKVVNDFKAQKEFKFYMTEGFYVSLDGYNHKIVREAQDIIMKNYKCIKEDVKTPAGSDLIITLQITGEEVLEILEAIKNNKQVEITKKETEKSEKETVKIEELKEVARTENKDVVHESYSLDCDDDNEACDIDTITTYITPMGSFKTVRSHSW